MTSAAQSFQVKQLLRFDGSPGNGAVLDLRMMLFIVYHYVPVYKHTL